MGGIDRLYVCLRGKTIVYTYPVIRTAIFISIFIFDLDLRAPRSSHVSPRPGRSLVLTMVRHFSSTTSILSVNGR